MNTTPILYRAEMVRALLEDRKSQTRRVVKPQPKHLSPVAPYLRPNGDWAWVLAETGMGSGHTEDGFRCPYGQPGDLLWVREAFVIHDGRAYYREASWYPEARVFVDHPTAPQDTRWKPSIHMPRWASRLTLRITNVRVERVQEISDEDALAEGITEVEFDGGSIYFTGKPIEGDEDEVPFSQCTSFPSEAFRDLWDTMRAATEYAWDRNPWVWVIEFEVIQRNVDEVTTDGK